MDEEVHRDPFAQTPGAPPPARLTEDQRGALTELGRLSAGEGALLFGVGNTTNNILESSLAQSVTPDALLGRVNASLTFLVGGMLPIGSLGAGGLATQFGPRPVLLLAGLGLSSAFLWLFFSPIWRLRELPEAEVS